MTTTVTTNTTNAVTLPFSQDPEAAWTLDISCTSHPFLEELTQLNTVSPLEGRFDVINNGVVETLDFNYIGTVDSSQNNVSPYLSLINLEITPNPLLPNLFSGTLMFSVTINDLIYIFISDSVSKDPNGEFVFMGGKASFYQDTCTDIADASWSATAQG